MLVIAPHSKDRKSTIDKADIGNPEVNRGCPPLQTNRTLADTLENSFGPSILNTLYSTGDLPYWVFQRYGCFRLTDRPPNSTH